MGQVHASKAEVSETAQKAIILHNGEEEVLILGTDLHADRKGGIIRFIPFPSEPEVALAPTRAFEAAAKLIKDHGLKFVFFSKGGPPSAHAVEVRLHEKLGAHDMTVIRVNDPLQFRKWANDYFLKRGLPVRKKYAKAETVVENYVRRGMVYFVVDYVELTRDTRFIEPVVYRFASKKLYYPLKTSNTFGGRGFIDLILITPGTLCDPMRIGYGCLGVLDMQGSTSAAVPASSLREIYPEAKNFFGDKKVFLQMAQYWGGYGFDKDILADMSKAVPHAIQYVPDEGPSGLDMLRELTK
ncbi:MAG: DUF2330 domain-containing protein [Nitrospiraceae bacterium]|nr:DUF2330 domain-containing protein [Nitrospiraceae bacterium]